MKLKIKAKLLLGFLAVALLALFVGYMGIVNMKAIDDADTMLYEQAVVPMEYAADMATYFQRIRVNIRDIVDAEAPTDIQKFENRITELEGSLKESDSKYKALLFSDEGKALFAKYETARDAYLTDVSELVDLAKMNNDSLADELMHGAMLQKNENFQKAIDEVLSNKIKQAT